jgi:hypothetical protein
MCPMLSDSKEYIHYNVKISDANDDEEEPSDLYVNDEDYEY